MKIGNLQIDIAENGFIVYENNREHTMIGRQWAFESAKTLSEFIYDWGQGNKKVKNKLDSEK